MERHDFATPCDSRTSVWSGTRWVDLRLCDESAAWWARLLCCPRVIFSCDRHKKIQSSRCSSCSSTIDRSVLVWGRL